MYNVRLTPWLLLEERHSEWPSDMQVTSGVLATQVERSVYGRVTWSF